MFQPASERSEVARFRCERGASVSYVSFRAADTKSRPRAGETVDGLQYVDL